MNETSGQPNRPTINEVIRRSREAAALSQETVARAAQLTQSTYSRFEMGEADIDLAVLFRIKEFLDTFPRKKARGFPLRWLMSSEAMETLPQPITGKLTEQIAKEMEQDWKHRCLLAERAQDEKENQEAIEEVKRLEARASKSEALERENAKLKMQIQELRRGKVTSGASSKKKKARDSAQE